MQEFITAAREDFDPEAEESTVVSVDGHEVTFFKPTPAQLMLVAAASQADDWTAAGGYLSTFLNLADDESRRYLWARLQDRKDSFDLDNVNEIMEYLLEQWSARPTKRPSDYRRPASPTGQRSTATSRAGGSTSSATRRAARSTSSSSG